MGFDDIYILKELFLGLGLGGYLETSEGRWNSWSHSVMRLLGRSVLEPWKGSGTTRGTPVHRRGHTTLGCAH
jgi:hypothetical protein